jgi:hypothetical protein
MQQKLVSSNKMAHPYMFYASKKYREWVSLMHYTLSLVNQLI